MTHLIGPKIEIAEGFFIKSLLNTLITLKQKIGWRIKVIQKNFVLHSIFIITGVILYNK